MFGSKLWECMAEEGTGGPKKLVCHYAFVEQGVVSLLHAFRAASPVAVVEVKPFTLKDEGTDAVL